MDNSVPPPPPTPSQVTNNDSPASSTRRRPRRWPWVIGLIAAGGLGGLTVWALQPEPEVIEVEPADMTERRTQLDQRSEQLGAQSSDLDDRQAEIDTQSSDLDEREAELDERADELQERADELDERDDALTETEDEIAENTIPGSGIYLVGEDIQPGTYRSEGSTCYWARLSGTSGEFNDIIANDNVEGTAYVSIAASDVAFETSRCGEWTLQ